MTKHLRLLLLLFLLAWPVAAQTSPGNIQPPTTTTLLSAVTTNTNSSALTVRLYGAVLLDVTITGGTVNVNLKGRIDTATSYRTLTGSNNADGTAITTITATGSYIFPTAGMEDVEVFTTSISGATVTVKARPIPSVGKAMPSGGGGVSGSGTSGRVAYWNGTSSLTGDSDLTFATDTLTVTKAVIGGGSAITSSGPGGALGSNAFTSTAYVPQTTTVNSKALSGNITLGLASSDFANQGTTTTILHGNAAGNPAFGQVVNADIANATIDLTAKVAGVLPAANGGTGVANNAASTITISGNFGTTFTVTGTTGVTLPTSGTLLTTTGSGAGLSGIPTSIAGTANQVTASASTGAVTLSTPQDIATSSTPQFARLGLGAAADGTALLSVNGALLTASAGAFSLTGAAGNMTITSGTGASRTMIFKTTTSGSVATTALTLGADQSATFADAITAANTITASKNVAGNFLTASFKNTNTTGGNGAFLELAGNTSVFDIYNDNNTPGLQVRYGNTLGSLNTTTTPLSITWDGVLTIAKTLTANGTGNNSFAGPLVTSSTTDSTTTTSGALQVAGGAAIRKRLFIDGITTSSSLQTAVLCQSSGGEMIADSVACLASSGRFKQDIKPLAVGLDEVMRLRPVSYRYKPEGIFSHNANYLRERVGFIAESVATIDERFIGYEADGKTPRTVSYETMVPLLVKSIQELKGEVDTLKAEIQSLKSRRVPFYLPSVIGL